MKKNNNESIFGGLKRAVGELDGALGEAVFRTWYAKLCAGAFALRGERIALTGAHFEKAMRQAFLAGRSSWRDRK